MNGQSEGKLFNLVAPYQPTGDQPEAIEKLVSVCKLAFLNLKIHTS